jgi:hypothetical protein
MSYSESKQNLINVINYINNNKKKLDIDCQTNLKLLIKFQDLYNQIFIVNVSVSNGKNGLEFIMILIQKYP